MIKSIIYTAVIVSVVTYSFWDELETISFYKGNAIFITLLCIVIFMQNRSYFISFFLLCISINNLLDELIFDPTKIGINEYFLLVSIPIIWLIKRKRNARKIHQQ